MPCFHCACRAYRAAAGARRFTDESTAARLHTSVLVRRVSVDTPIIPATFTPMRSAQTTSLNSWDFNPFVEVRGRWLALQLAELRVVACAAMVMMCDCFPRPRQACCHTQR